MVKTDFEKSPRTAFMYPGQGSIEPGSHIRAIRHVSEARELFEFATEYASERLGKSVKKIMTEGPKEELVDTKMAQPATFISSIVGSTALRNVLERDASRRMYHSFGMFAAMHDDEVFDTTTGLDLVIARGQFMYEAAQEKPGAMAAVFHLAEERLSEICRKYGIWVANENSDTEIIISGEEEGVDKSQAEIEAEGGIFFKLKGVKSGAPHTPMVAIAAEKMSALVHGKRVGNFHIPVEKIHAPANLSVFSSRTVDLLRNLGDVRADIGGMTERVKWNGSVLAVVADGYREFYETGPGNKLSKLQKRAPIMKTILQSNGVVMKTVDELINATMV
ncbi:MAG TPA: ACP S-malonyltransferase [Candidatus Babeliales bacterium]|nr:ACP S-malonyltransferase [Candidatus Babeliales bacterium]